MARHRPAIEGTTRVVGIFGDPVDHSLSPRMHNAAFHELGLDYVYVPLRPLRERIGEAVRAIKTLGLVGVNVTVPFKESVARSLSTVTETARAVGAVNTIYRDKHGELIGGNTDVPGFTAALTAHGITTRSKRALVIGAGGAARAVVHALLSNGAADVVVANRTLPKAANIARAYRQHRGRIHASGLEILDDLEFLGDRQLVVNTTSLGLKGSRFLDYDVDATMPDCVHVDLVYGEKPTAFLANAEATGRPAIDGRHMLLHQGAIAFKLFTGRKAPVDVMAHAIGIRK